jgi:phosphatidylglycerophosphate synthase
VEGDARRPRRWALEEQPGQVQWKTKPSDRFILKWIKCHLSARISPRLVGMAWLRPWMITVTSASLSVAAGVLFAVKCAWLGGLVAACSQILDGVDGQLARLTGRQSPAGAFLDSVMDRYGDGCLVIGSVVYAMRLSAGIPAWQLLALATLALIGSNLISYSSARADSLGISLGKPTFASKGTRTTVTALCGMGSLVWAPMPVAALAYVAVHTNLVLTYRLFRVVRS